MPGPVTVTATITATDPELGHVAVEFGVSSEDLSQPYDHDEDQRILLEMFEDRFPEMEDASVEEVAV